MGFQDDCISRTGTIQGCMIFADFSDAQSPASESVEELRDLLIPDAAKWYQTASYGQLELNITADTTKFYRMPKSAASYKGEEVEGGVKASVVAKNDTSALVVEARVAKGVDGNICAPGVLLYTVDTTLAMSEGSIKVLDVTPGSNGYGDANGAVERRDFVDEWEEVV
ncbi:hypothetical protein FVEG_08519 [Fusarium verticillioides 7600]|uniref:Uncharacterized protein n=1 Tax=Gibberella moniliformis (strain M3125 / FGSC 7600) TaxID=334819 RepID=W7MMV9_GIBM7|nr:hypothetical protein FVEG_08519 [Fusarium verticillioides 7600]EWG48865.1 hypothetical protein FVEG_08519 [Fusarium verticillioides 7600]